MKLTFTWENLITVGIALLLLHSTIVNGGDFGVIWNDDGNWSITSEDPSQAKLGVEFVVDLLAGTPVKTLVYGVGVSCLVDYPSNVASTWGWRKTPKYEADKEWAARIRKGRALAAAGFDPIQVAGTRAKKLNLYFVPSYRMSDDHFIWDPNEYPLTGKFWIDNQKYAIKNSGASPIDSYSEYGNALDFSHKSVREFRLAVINEIIDRNQDLMDGIELDFSRCWVLFPKGQAQAKAHLITEMVETIRTRLDKVAETKGRKLYLFVRVPTTLRSCLWAGLDVEKWCDKRLVDVLIPTDLMIPVFEGPTDEFVAIAKKADCKVYAGLYNRVGWEWPFVERPTSQTYSVKATKSIPTAMMRALVSNAWFLGVDGMYLFNMRYEEGGGGPFTDAYIRTIRDSAHPACLNGESKIYTITKSNWLDFEDTYTYKKQLPSKVQPGQEAEFKMLIGENFDPQITRAKLSYCGLRLGLRGCKASDTVSVSLNKHTIFAGDLGTNLISINAEPPPHSQGMSPAAKAFWQIPVKPSDLKQGWNVIVVKLNGSEEVIITDINIGVFYNNNLNEMLVN